MSFIIVLAALAFLMLAAYRGYSVILFAPVAALAAVLLTDPAAVAPDVRELVRPPLRIGEPEDVHVVRDAPRHVGDPQDGIDALEVHGRVRGVHVQNIVLLLADVGGIGWSTSQCSTIRPSGSRRKMSIPAQLVSPGHSWKQCSTT